MWNRSIVSQLKAEYAGLLYSFHQMQGFRLYCFSPTPFFPFSRCNLSLKFHSSQRRCLCSLTMTHEPEIQSLKNPRVKAARALIRRRQREKENKILLEGQRLISDALEKGVVPLDFYYTKEGLERNEANFLLLSKMRSKGASHILVSDPVIRSFSDTTNPQVR